MARSLSLRAAWLAVFAASGAAGLVYQVVWARKLTLALGVSAQAVAVLLATFMGGLAIGSALGGRWSERTKPARLYALVEVALAALGFASAYALDALPNLFGELARSLGTGAALVAARAGIAAIVLLPPTILMGMTLPALVKTFAGIGGAAGGGGGALYAANTLGAAGGTLVAAFFLIERFGLRGTTLVAAGANAAVGLVAFALAAMHERAPERAARAAARDARSAEIPAEPSERRRALQLTAVFGFATLANETLWTRALIYAVGDNSAFAFAEMLATVLVGIVIGGAVASAFVERVRRPLAVLGVLAVAYGVAVAVGLCTLQPHGRGGAAAVGFGWGESLAATKEPFAEFAWRAFAECARVVLAPAVLSGAAMPFVLRIVAGGSGAEGREAGRALAVNTLASVAGALVGGFLLLPAFGFATGLAITATGAAAAGAAIAVSPGLAVTPSGRLVRLLPALLVAAVGGAFCVRTCTGESPAAQALTRGQSNLQLLFYRDGASASVGVVRRIDTDDRVLWVDGDAQAGTDASMRLHLGLLGHLGPALHPNPKRGLVVGLGAGVTLAALASHPFERIDVAELSCEVREAAPLFERANHRAFEDPRVHITFEDGRNFLLASEGGYDVITSDPIDPDDAGVTSLYSEEYFRLVRSRLAPGGVACHWIPTQYSTEVYASLIQAFRRAFPTSFLFDAEFTTVIVGRREDAPPTTIERMNAACAEPRVRASLAEFFLDTPADLLALRRAGPSGLERFCGDAPPNTDDRPIAEYQGPRSLHGRTPASWSEKLERLDAVRERALAGIVAEPSGAERAALDAAFDAVGRAMDARRRMPLLAKELVPAARAYLFALRRPGPRVVDLLCWFDRPEFGADEATSAFDEAFGAGLDALERRDARSALAAFDVAEKARPSSPRAALGRMVAAFDGSDWIAASRAGVDFARRVPMLESLAGGILKLVVDRLLASLDDENRGAAAAARLGEMLPPEISGAARAAWRERWRALHRELRFDAASGRFTRRAAASPILGD